MKNEPYRPSPDELLKAIKYEENAKSKGRLKIFLGMAAGVGKTYAMLDEARLLTKSGVDVAVGVVDTHQRKETMALLEGLKVIPEKTVTYKNLPFKEMDLEEIIKQKPTIVLVDELAHSNIPGLRHEKRWQDVMEILDNGIDVYTTLNVQHIESLKDVVEEITGVAIKETVPDIIIEQANSIQLIDLNPDALLLRLAEGKVYLGDQSKMAILNFFKKNKLTALREILLRYTAEKVDHDLHQMFLASEPESQWKPREKLLVAVGPSPHSQKLIRATRRFAFNLEAPWIAVYVDTGQTLSDVDELQLSKNLNLARDLGAEVITTHDPDIANAIHRTARKRGVTQIILGRSPPAKFFSFFNRFHLLDKLANECTDIDIHVIRQEGELTNQQKKLRAANPKTSFSSYFKVFLSVSSLAILGAVALPFIGYKVVGEFFFISILFLSLFFKKGPVFFAAFLFSFIWYFIFTPEESRFSIETFLLLLIYVLTAAFTGILVDRYRKHQEMLVKREESSVSLYRIIRQIGSASTLETVFTEVTSRLETMFGSPFEIIVKGLHGGLEISGDSKLISNEKEKGAALWAFDNGVEAGWSTDTLPSAENLYIPIKNQSESFGLLVFKKKPGKMPSLDEKNFLYTVSQQLCNCIERSFSEEKEKQNETRLQIEKINRTIFRRLTEQFKPSLAGVNKSLIEFKHRLEVINNKDLSHEFSEIEKAFEQLTKTFKHTTMMAEPKDK